jgi:hypothetical protein
MKEDLNFDIANLFADISEAGLDQLINDPFMKDIPVLGSLINLARISKTISDRIFLIKIKTFLDALKDDKEPDWNKFKENIRSNEKQYKKAQETILFLIDRSDNLDKVKILAKVFDEFLEKKITYENFHRISFAIDKAFIDDLLAFIQLDYPPGEEHTNLLLALVPTGLVELSNRVRNTYGGYHTNPLLITSTGKLFLEIMKNVLQ